MKRTLSLVPVSLLSSALSSVPALAASGDPVITLESTAWIAKERAAAASAFGSTQNLRKLYSQLAGQLKASPTASSAAQKLLVQDVSRLSAIQLKSGIRSLSSALRNQTLFPSIEAMGPSVLANNLTLPNENCGDETGAESQLDMQYTYRNSWANGSLVKNVNFPLRQHLSCVRNQGSRGTCTAFASTAALEVLVHQETERYVNFSEQHLYLWAYANVDPDSSEGLPTEKTVRMMTSEGYRAVLESGWQYNPSKHRSDQTDSGLDGTFADVCVGYTEASSSVAAQGGEYCSETIHQGEEVTIRRSVSAGGSDYTLTSKDYRAPSSARATSYGFGRAIQIWDESNPDDSLTLAQAYLRSGIPLVFGGGVTAGFKANAAKGFVPYIRNEANVGGHAMLLVGWVSNADLPAGAPSGSGGGYFIFKNSWGMSVNNSDRGYYYAPYNYMKEHTAGMTAVLL